MIKLLDAIVKTREDKQVRIYLKDGAIVDASSVEMFDYKHKRYVIEGCFLDGDCESGLLLSDDEVEKIEVIK